MKTASADQASVRQRLDLARQRLHGIVGDAGFLDQGDALRPFHDPYEGTGAVDHQPSFAVLPDGVDQIRAILGIARELGVHVWTSSMGRNFGYGGAAPVVNGGIVLNLRRMNRIIDIDARQGVALIEPGVTFDQLYAELRRNDIPLMMSVPDLGWGSMTANALEHGYGYGVQGDHASALCGLEVVLADGEVLRTGQGAIPGSPLWSCHRRGFGPSIDDLFKQSNLGIVTKAGVQLIPRPESIVTGTIRCEREGDIIPLIEVLRGLMHQGVVQGIPMIVSSAGGDRPAAAGEGRFTAANLRHVLRPGRWNARIGLYGPAPLVDARRTILESALTAIPGAVLELRHYPGHAGPDEVEPRDLIAAGIPNRVLLDRLTDVFGETLGHIDFSPVLPFTGEAALRAEALVQEVLARHGLIGPFGLLLTGRSMVSVSMILFDTADPARVAAARLAVGELIDAVGEWGAAPYRAHIALVDKVQSRFDYNAHAIGRTYARIKQAFDPAGILSPGNHGIWPERPSS